MKRLLSVICLAGLSFMACKKDDDVDPPPPPPDPDNVIGYWEGTYVDNSRTPAASGFFGFLLRADSTARIYVDDPGAEFTDTSAVASRTEASFKHVNDDKKLTFVYVVESAPTVDLATSGTINAAVTGIAGTWGRSPSVTDKGTYTVTKK